MSGRKEAVFLNRGSFCQFLCQIDKQGVMDLDIEKVNDLCLHVLFQRPLLQPCNERTLFAGRLRKR